jgi:uncharacterized membrane protein (DUF485 family)
MHADIVRRVRSNPKFEALEASRSRYGWTLAILMLVIYYGFILLVAFDKSFLAINVGGVITMAFPVGLFVLVSAIVITGLYVHRANSVYDAMTHEIVEESR